jgi:hypothetical protein
VHMLVKVNFFTKANWWQKKRLQKPDYNFFEPGS